MPWGFFGMTDPKAETPVLWPPHAKSWLIGKYSDAGRDWGQEEKGTTEDEMAGWHHWLDGHESEWTPGVGDGQRGLACCDSWDRKESDTTEWLNWLTEWLKHLFLPKITVISYKKQITSPGLMQDTGCLGLVHWDDPEGWYGEGGGRGVQNWEYVYTYGGFRLMHGKTNTIL